MEKKWVVASTRGFIEKVLPQSGIYWTTDFSKAQQFESFAEADKLTRTAT